MTIKDKLAATLLNHWYIIGRSLDTHRLKKVPVLKDKYEPLDRLESLDPKELHDLIDQLAAYNGRTFGANIAHLVENDKIMVNFGATATEAKLKNFIKVAVSLPLATGLELDSLIKAMTGTTQADQLLSILKGLPKILHGADKSSITIDVPCSHKNFYKSYYTIETNFISNWNAIKTILAAHKYIIPLLSITDKAEVIAGRAFIDFVNPSIKDNIFTADQFVVRETEAAKIQRELRERLEAALKRRIKTIRSVKIDGESIKYTFEDADVPPFTVELDVITHW